MICFDCGKKKNKGVPVIELSVIGRESPLPSQTVKKVCARCWRRNWMKWMPHTAKLYDEKANRIP